MSADFFLKSTFFKNSLKNTIGFRFGPDLVTNWLHRLSADDKISAAKNF